MKRYPLLTHRLTCLGYISAGLVWLTGLCQLAFYVRFGDVPNWYGWHGALTLGQVAVLAWLCITLMLVNLED